MSPKEPEPIFLINLYLPPTMNSFFAIDTANDAMSLLSSVCLLLSFLHSVWLFPNAGTSTRRCSFAPALRLPLSLSLSLSSTHSTRLSQSLLISLSLSTSLSISLALSLSNQIEVRTDWAVSARFAGQILTVEVAEGRDRCYVYYTGVVTDGTTNPIDSAPTFSLSL